MGAARGNKRLSIVEAAAHLIRSEGVHAASISEIIREAHASAGTIYHHFANKNDIVLAVAQAAVVEPLQEMLAQESGEGTSPGALLRQIVAAVMGGDVESALIVQLWAGSSREPQLKEVLRSQMAEVHAGMTREIARWLAARGVPDADRRAVSLAHVTMGQAMGLLAERTILTDLDRAAYLDEATRLLDAAASAPA
nr:TetR/AcrR family transcriptional regulator [Propionibacterium sp.]